MTTFKLPEIITPLDHETKLRMCIGNLARRYKSSCPAPAHPAAILPTNLHVQHLPILWPSPDFPTAD